MLNKSIFKAYDVRGLYPKDVNKESIGLIASALGGMWKGGTVIVAHDGRHGSPLLAKTVAAKLNDQKKKFEVIFVGLATTPMFYFLVNRLKASGGAMITASHNPKEYNGVKAVNPGAQMISGTELLACIEKNGYKL